MHNQFLGRLYTLSSGFSFALVNVPILLLLCPLQVSNSNWDNNSLWSLESPFFSSSSVQDTIPDERSPASGPLGGQRSFSDASGQPFPTTTYDLFENQSIWSLNDSDSSDLLSWAQLKPDQSEGKHSE